MPRPKRVRPLVCDSSSLIDLERSKELRVLSYVAVLIPSKVAEEVNQRGSLLAAWLRDNRASVKRPLDQEGGLYLRLLRDSRPRIDDGEALAIAMASHRNLELMIEDGAGRLAAERIGVHCLGWRELMARVQLL
jgi:predicted nucleic acid-binding protein